MKILVILGTTLLLVGISTAAAQAESEQDKDNFLGPIVTFVNGQTSVGIGGKLKITDSIAVRPSYSFANLSGSGVTVAGGSATYEFDTKDSAVAPFVGAGVNIYNVNTGGTPGSAIAPFAQAGLDIKTTTNIAVTIDVKVPLTNEAPLGTVVSVGGGYRF
jgi:outer membrane protein W